MYILAHGKEKLILNPTEIKKVWNKLRLFVFGVIVF